MNRILCICCILIVLSSSCKNVVSSNFPGKAENTIPTNWQGRYVLTLPSILSAVETMDDNGQPLKQYVTIEKNRIVWDHSPEVSIYTLNDSLFISTVDGEKYISVKTPDNYYQVLQVKEKGRNLFLTGLYTERSVDKSRLQEYFSNVKEPTGSGDDASGAYTVTIVDRKLKDYFIGPLSTRDRVEMVRQ